MLWLNTKTVGWFEWYMLPVVSGIWKLGPSWWCCLGRFPGFCAMVWSRERPQLRASFQVKSLVWAFGLRCDFLASLAAMSAAFWMTFLHTHIISTGYKYTSLYSQLLIAVHSLDRRICICLSPSQLYHSERDPLLGSFSVHTGSCLWEHPRDCHIRHHHRRDGDTALNSPTTYYLEKSLAFCLLNCEIEFTGRNMILVLPFVSLVFVLNHLLK